jgi:predicted MFS family arabinose efflux permease
MGTTERQLPTAAGQSSKLAVGWLTMFVIGSDLFVVSPLLPLIAADYGIQPSRAGLSVTIFSASYMLSAPLLGAVADRFGRARIMTWCLLAFGAANLLTAACGDFAWLLAARMAAGVTAAGVTPSVYALVGGGAPSEKRATWLAVVVSGLLMSLSFGAPIGVLAGASLGWPIVFGALGLVSLGLAAANSRVWTSGQNTGASPTPSSRFTAAAVLHRLSPTVVWSAAVYSMYTYLGDGLTSRGYSAEAIAGVLLFYGAGAIIGALAGGRITDRFGANATTSIGLAGLCICLLLTRAAVDAGVLVHCTFALSSAFAQLFFPAQQLRLANDFPARRATILAWNNSALFLGIALGSLIGGQAMSLGGLDANLTIAAGISSFGWIVNSRCRARLARVIRHAPQSALSELPRRPEPRQEAPGK